MKYDQRTLIRRMLVRITVWLFLFGGLFIAMFFASGNTLIENFDVFAFSIGIAAAISIFVGCAGLVWEAINGNEDPRYRKKKAAG